MQAFFLQTRQSSGLRGKISTILEWPVHSPDLNLVENVWGIMDRRLYANVKKCDTVAQLKSSIM